MNLPSLLIFVIDHLLILFFKQKLIMIVKTNFDIKKNHKPIIFLQLQKKRTINLKKLYKKLIIKKKYYISIQY